MSKQVPDSTSDKLLRLIEILEDLAMDLNGLRYIAQNYLFREDWRALLNEYRHVNGVSNSIRSEFVASRRSADRAQSPGDVDHTLDLLLNIVATLLAAEAQPIPTGDAEPVHTTAAK